MKFAGKIAMLDRLVAELKAERVNPYANLTPLERETVEAYKRNTLPLQQWIDAMEGTSPVASLHQGIGLRADCTEPEARTAYEKELAFFNQRYSRRQALQRIR